MCALGESKGRNNQPEVNVDTLKMNKAQQVDLVALWVIVVPTGALTASPWGSRKAEFPLIQEHPDSIWAEGRANTMS